MSGGNTGGVGEGNWANTGGTNYAVGSNTFQAPNSPVQIGGFQRGGVTRRVAYDDGGGVSPSALGPPPALAGGQNPIPPYYFNPATYAPAGAPVGKGVSMTSAPTYVAGAIPSLPMTLGGVVTRYADGGGVDADEAELQNASYQADMEDSGDRDDAATPTAAPAPILSDNPPPGGNLGYRPPVSASQEALPQPCVLLPE